MAKPPTLVKTDHQIGAKAPRRHHRRLSDWRIDHHLHLREMARDGVAVVAFCLVASPVWIGKRWWRLADWLAIPTVFVFAVHGVGFDHLLFLPIPTPLSHGLRLPLVLAVPSFAYVPWYAWIRLEPPWFWRLVHVSHARVVPKPLADHHGRRWMARDNKRLAKRFVNPPVLTKPPERHTHVVRRTCRLPENVIQKDMDRMPAELEKLYRHPTSITYPNNWSCILHEHLSDPLKHRLPRPALETVTDGAIPAGKDIDGDEVTLRLNGHRFLIGGMPGAGKSAFTSSVVGYTLRLPYVDVREFDPKGGMDLKWSWPFCSHVAQSPAEGLELLERTRADLEARQSELGRMSDIGMELAPIGPRFPLIVLVMDEFYQVLAGPGKARAEQLIVELASLGRASGFVLWLAQQDMRRATLPTGLVGRFTRKIGFATTDYVESETILPGCTSAGYPLHNLPADQPGRCVMWGGPTRWVSMRTYALDGDARIDEVSELSRLRPVAVPEASPPVSPMSTAAVPGDIPQLLIPPNPTQTAPTTEELRRMTLEKVRAAGGLGVLKAELARTFDVPEHRVKRALEFLRGKGYVWNDAVRWHITEKGAKP